MGNEPQASLVSADPDGSTQGSGIAQTEGQVPGGLRGSGRLGCLLTLVAGLVCVGIAYLILEHKAAGRLPALRELDQMRQEASSLPGVEKLREAGCAQAGVLDVPRARRLTQSLEDALAAKQRRYPQPVDLGTTRAVAVLCAARPDQDKIPSCEQVERVYRQAMVPTQPFAVAVMINGDLHCGKDAYIDGKASTDAPQLRLPPLFGGQSLDP